MVQEQERVTGVASLAWAMLGAIPDGVFMVDDSGRIVFANPAAEALFGYERGTLLGEDIEGLVPAGLRDTHRAHRARYNQAPRTRLVGAGLVLHGVRRDGTHFPADISLSPLVEGSNRLIVATVRLPSNDGERTQLATEVATTAIHRLSSIGMLVAASLDAPSDVLRQRATELIEHIDEIIHELRNMALPIHDTDNSHADTDPRA